MKQYDSIPAYNSQFEHKYSNQIIYAFDKLDGSNIRVEYNPKKGFEKFGSRNVLIDETSELGFVIKIFREKWEGILYEKIKKNKQLNKKTTYFFELEGKQSKFGFHNIGHDNLDLYLIDVSPHGETYLPPDEFYEIFKDTNIPRLIYKGILNSEFINAVINNEFSLKEGVIIKGIVFTKKGIKLLLYTKIKTNKWFEELKNKLEYLYKLEYYEHIVQQRGLNNIEL